MKVEVCYAEPSGATRIDVELAPGATLDDALTCSGIEARLGLDRDALAFAIFGRRATLHASLHDGDRVELLRPLMIDPMEARRLRAQKTARKRTTPE